MIFGKKNQRETVPEGGTRQGARLPPSWPPVRRLLLFFGRKKANFREKISAKVSIQSELRISIYIYIYETVKGQKTETQKQKKQRETGREIQSWRGSRPSHAMEAKDQRGNPSPI